MRYYQIFTKEPPSKEDAESGAPTKQALIFLQEKIKPLTDDTEVLFACTKMVVRRPAAFELEQQMSELMSKITKTFYKVFFVVEGYNRSFILENVLLVGVTSWESRPARVTDAVRSSSPSRTAKRTTTTSR